MSALLALVMLSSAPVELESIDLQRWAKQLAAPKTRCQALAEIGFQDSEWKCLHASAEEKKRVAVVNRYRLSPGIELVCAGPARHRCTQLVALHDGRRVPLFVPASVLEYRFHPEKTLRVSMLQQWDCRGAHGELRSCPQETPRGRVEVTERGVEFMGEWETFSAPGPYLRPATTAPVRFVRARSIGEVKGQVRWRGDALCIDTRCYDATTQRWTSARGAFEPGVEVTAEVSTIDGHTVKFEPAFRPECGGFRQLVIDERPWALRDLDVDEMLPLPESEYPTRGISRLVFSPSGRTGVAFVPRFARLSKTTGDAVPCGDANFSDWHAVAYELFFFENPSAQ